MATRHPGRGHRRRRRTPPRPRVRHQFGGRRRRRTHHRGGRRTRRRCVRRLACPGVGSDRGHGRGVGTDRRPARRRKHRPGHRAGRPDRAGRRCHRTRPGCDVHPVAGDRGIHARHRGHHLPAAGSRGVRHHESARREDARSGVADPHQSRLDPGGNHSRRGRADRTADDSAAPSAPGHPGITDGGRRGHRAGRRAGHTDRHHRRTAVSAARPGAPARRPRRTARRRRCGTGHRRVGGNRLPALGAGRRDDGADRTLRPRPGTGRSGARLCRIRSVRRDAGDRRNRPHGRQREIRRPHPAFGDHTLGSSARCGLPGYRTGIGDPARRAGGRADGHVIPDDLRINHPEDLAFHPL